MSAVPFIDILLTKAGDRLHSEFVDVRSPPLQKVGKLIGLSSIAVARYIRTSS
ncbi:hypothetical protein [Anabaena sp. CCY 9910]|uniref:hypothetical protein n=1 Tax=Anabaena sp. CCY 9910 TaxID=3103870 RepID=UPI0039DF8396